MGVLEAGRLARFWLVVCVFLWGESGPTTLNLWSLVRYSLTKKASWWFPNLGHFQVKLRVTIGPLVRRDVGIRPGYPQVIVPFIRESDRVPNHRASNHQLTTRWFKSSSVVCMISILMNITLSRPVPTIHFWTHSPSTAHPSNGPLIPGVLWKPCQIQETCHDHPAPVSCIFGGSNTQKGLIEKTPRDLTDKNKAPNLPTTILVLNRTGINCRQKELGCPRKNQELSSAKTISLEMVDLRDSTLQLHVF